MAIWQRYNVKQPVTDRAPDQKSLLPWIQREGYAFFQQVRRVLNWAVGYLGKLGIDADDVPDVAENKLIAATGVTITKKGDPGDRTLEFSADAGAITNLVTTNLINNTTYTTSITNVINQTNAPPSEGSYLFPALVTDSKLRTRCKCHLAFASGIGWNSDQWTALTTGLFTWQHNYNGAIEGYVSGGGTTPLSIGDRVYIAYDGGTGMGGLGGPSPYLGIYEVLDPGTASTQATIRRALDANTPATLCNGMVVEVGASPALSDYPAIVTADPIVVDTVPITLTDPSTWKTPYVSSQSFPLLTQAELATQTNLASTSQIIAASASYGAKVYLQEFETLAGLGLTEFPVGIITMTFEGVWVDVNLDGFSFLGCELWTDEPSLICQAESPPLNALEKKIVLQARRVTPHAMSPTTKLRWRPYIRSTSSFSVPLNVRYGYPYVTRVQVPFSLASGGSDGIHDHLTGRNTVNNHFGVGTATTVSGIIPVPTKKRMVVTLDSNPILQGMHAEGLESGVEVELTFLQACSLVGEAPGLPAGQAKFLLSHMDGSSPDNIEFGIGGGRIGVTYYATELPQSPCFQLTWGPVS